MDRNIYLIVVRKADMKAIIGIRRIGNNVFSICRKKSISKIQLKKHNKKGKEKTSATKD